MIDKHWRKRTRECGSVLTEYVITTGVVIVALFLPVPGLGVSAIEVVVNALNAFQAHSTVMLSMP